MGFKETLKTSDEGFSNIGLNSSLKSKLILVDPLFNYVTEVVVKLFSKIANNFFKLFAKNCSIRLIELSRKIVNFSVYCGFENSSCARHEIFRKVLTVKHDSKMFRNFFCTHLGNKDSCGFVSKTLSSNTCLVCLRNPIRDY